MHTKQVFFMFICGSLSYQSTRKYKYLVKKTKNRKGRVCILIENVISFEFRTM